MAVFLPLSFAHSLPLSFSPTSISGLSLWLDGSDSSTMTMSSSNVTQWNDKSGNNNVCSNSTSSNSPVYTASTLNGLSVLSFTGQSTSTQWLDNTTMTFPNTSNTIFAVAYNNNSTTQSYTANNYIISGRADKLISYSSYTSNYFTTFVGSGSSWYSLAVNSPNQNMNGVWSITAMTLSGSVLTPYFNGTTLNTRSGSMGATTGFIIGDAPAGFRGQCWNGYIAEIMIFNVVLTTTQRQQIEGYLAWKWGLTSSLPAGHPYKNSRP